MRVFLLCSLVLLVAMPVFAGEKEKKDLDLMTPGNGSRGLLDCTGAVELICDDPAVAGDNTGLANNVVNYGCSTLNENGGEVVFFFTLATETYVTITEIPDPVTTPDLDIWLLGSCDEADCIDYSAGVTTEVITACLDAGTYYVVVDGYGSSVPGAEGPFTIELTCGDCPEEPDEVQGSETCDGAPSLCDYVANDMFNIIYDLTGFLNDYDADNAGCTGWGSSGSDMVYEVCLEAGGSIQACIDPDGYDDLALWLVSDCNDVDNSCVAGDDSGNPECIDYTSAAGGTYYLIVDMYSSLYGGPGLLSGTITGCCGGTATENSTWGSVKELFR